MRPPRSTACFFGATDDTGAADDRPSGRPAERPSERLAERQAERPPNEPIDRKEDRICPETR